MKTLNISVRIRNFQNNLKKKTLHQNINRKVFISLHFFQKSKLHFYFFSKILLINFNSFNFRKIKINVNFDKIIYKKTFKFLVFLFNFFKILIQLYKFVNDFFFNFLKLFYLKSYSFNFLKSFLIKFSIYKKTNIYFSILLKQFSFFFSFYTNLFFNFFYKIYFFLINILLNFILLNNKLLKIENLKNFFYVLFNKTFLESSHEIFYQSQYNLKRIKKISKNFFLLINNHKKKNRLIFSNNIRKNLIFKLRKSIVLIKKFKKKIYNEFSFKFIGTKKFKFSSNKKIKKIYFNKFSKKKKIIKKIIYLKKKIKRRIIKAIKKKTRKIGFLKEKILIKYFFNTKKALKINVFLFKSKNKSYKTLIFRKKQKKIIDQKLEKTLKNQRKIIKKRMIKIKTNLLKKNDYNYFFNKNSSILKFSKKIFFNVDVNEIENFNNLDKGWNDLILLSIFFFKLNFLFFSKFSTFLSNHYYFEANIRDSEHFDFLEQLKLELSSFNFNHFDFYNLFSQQVENLKMQIFAFSNFQPLFFSKNLYFFFFVLKFINYFKSFQSSYFLI